ncbi:hypothetical protein CHL78_017935 [Romboutsia weinsteinii]|uniref:Uncharacterized protein n=1 Tax=Romboutsia weinsteinii TaxID=2020949 RepID=A0A371IYD5_9FIRM|nr:hypothetical protein [Romboutsia weinsteinii]RDY25478.1 hypothetical protein CHL78_017935 [Romboutsia weinsteinii]
MNYLNDDNLEELGIIKEIDTLNIVEEAEKIKLKRNKILLIICFSLMMITSLVAQVLIVLLFGGVKMIKLGLLIYIAVLIVVSLILIDKGEKSLC